ncbi:methyl-accepting chemotaxis protein [Zobellella iuensis]|uniref:Methyl-accepting chemotaxis protein n=1 Tax=Zobellella iuensis TaxID=2803811 RepID=A0ABS1QLN3_9GAMM|nr:HAMP domain-containing methyl-accepting chemotaxis protein [Zobellella iuensis]MBL1375774.1 methyl-accepting chemotaxis protein [Zobellella iuensis]
MPTIKNLSITLKLCIGFGLLLFFVLLLSMFGLYGLHNNDVTLKRIAQIGNLFDEIVFTREANYQYALDADSQRAEESNQRHKNFQGAVEQLLVDADAGLWPSQDIAALKGLKNDLDRYLKVRAAAHTRAELLAANALLSALQDKSNELYYAEEERAAEQASKVFYLLIVITLVALVMGGIVTVVISRQIVLPLKQAVHMAQRIADGDLVLEQRGEERRDELGALLSSLDTMNASLRNVVAQMGSASHELTASASQLTTITDVTQGQVNDQKSETYLIASAMGEIAATVQDVARNAEETATAAKNAAGEVVNAQALSRRAIAQIESLSSEIASSADFMGRLQQECGRIGSILNVIKEVADQTNLLALNAAIEAARAGDAGRGFAVVADEVRNLAQRTQRSSNEIEQLIAGLQGIADESTATMQASVEHTQASVAAVRETGAALEVITRQVSNIQQMSELIATTTEEQAAVTAESNERVSTVRASAEVSAGASADIAVASGQLENLSKELNSLVRFFSNV